LYSDHVIADDIPVVCGEVDVDTLVWRVRELCPRLAVIKRAGAMPQQGVSSTFKYGVAYGALRTVVALCNIPYQLVTPSKWKNYFRLGADKEKSRAQLWPGCGFFRGQPEALAVKIARAFTEEQRKMLSIGSGTDAAHHAPDRGSHLPSIRTARRRS
jgi:hypothetical protein